MFLETLKQWLKAIPAMLLAIVLMIAAVFAQPAQALDLECDNEIGTAILEGGQIWDSQTDILEPVLGFLVKTNNGQNCTWFATVNNGSDKISVNDYGNSFTELLHEGINDFAEHVIIENPCTETIELEYCPYVPPIVPPKSSSASLEGTLVGAFAHQRAVKKDENLITNVMLYPQTPALLQNGDRVEVFFSYETKEPSGVWIMVQPLSGGSVPQEVSFDGSPLYPQGSGNGTGSFTMRWGNVTVDQIRFRMLSSDQTQIVYENFLPVHYLFHE